MVQYNIQLNTALRLPPHLFTSSLPTNMIQASHDLDILQKALDNPAEEGKRLGRVIHTGKTQAMACGRGDPTPHHISFNALVYRSNGYSVWCTAEQS